jgi:hypothetical protein
LFFQKKNTTFLLFTLALKLEAYVFCKVTAKGKDMYRTDLANNFYGLKKKRAKICADRQAFSLLRLRVVFQIISVE